MPASGWRARCKSASRALAIAAERDADLGGKLIQSYAAFLSVIEAVLARAHPDALPERLRAAAHGIAACIQTIDALETIGPPAQWRADLKAAALTRAARLGDQK